LLMVLTNHPYLVHLRAYVLLWRTWKRWVQVHSREGKEVFEFDGE